MIISAKNSDGKEELERSVRELTERVRAVTLKFLATVKDTANRFDRENDVRGKAKKLVNSTVEQYEIFEFYFKRRVSRFLVENELDEKFKKVTSLCYETAQDIDYKYRIKQNVSVWWEDGTRQYLVYKKKWDKFMNTSEGGILRVVGFTWFILSGWAFNGWVMLLLFSPTIFTILQLSLVKVEGKCPNCGLAFKVNKDMPHKCRQCGGTVWNPRKSEGVKFDKNDPNVIDIDVD